MKPFSPALPLDRRQMLAGMGTAVVAAANSTSALAALASSSGEVTAGDDRCRILVVAATPQRAREELGWMLEGSRYAWDAPATVGWEQDFDCLNRYAVILVHHSSGLAADFLSAVHLPRAIPPVIKITADTDGSARRMQERHPQLPFFFGTEHGGFLREPFGRDKLLVWIDRLGDKKAGLVAASSGIA